MRIREILFVFIVVAWSGCSSPTTETETLDVARDALHTDLEDTEVLPEDAAVDAVMFEAESTDTGQFSDLGWPNLDGLWPYETLSEYGFFAGPMAELRPRNGVYPYNVNAPLFSDHASKIRFIVLPPGAKMGFEADSVWFFPVGSILIKNFFYADDLRTPESSQTLIETRLLIHETAGWTGHVYLWDDAQSEAHRYIAGKIVTITQSNASGAPTNFLYVVPNTNQCKSCHLLDKAVVPIGVSTRQLNGFMADDAAENQIQHFESMGLLDNALPPAESWKALANPATSSDVTDLARSFLDSNCAHCHRPGGNGGSTGLNLNASVSTAVEYGVCKVPVAAGPGTGGFDYDIVPGKPDESIMAFRIGSTAPAIKMPELPNLQAPEEGLGWVRTWIEQMSPVGCD